VGFEAIFLTHHHPDHRQYADAIARRYGIPIHLSQDSFERINKKTNGRFFEGVETVIRAEGEVLTQWLGRDVLILEVPGHDEGQLALMPSDRAWCIVSDLFQGVGTVVIAKPEGNMRKYFATLERVIELDPKVIYPSHGMGMGTTYRLQATLAHRKLREAQILQLHAQGKNHEEMLQEVYAGLDPRLAPLALCNIESHLDKLREEQRI
jgi:glyoxylase-like metal-dependent hydrolase (beta-lactamase superfamily II)